MRTLALKPQIQEKQDISQINKYYIGFINKNLF